MIIDNLICAKQASIELAHVLNGDEFNLFRRYYDPVHFIDESGKNIDLEGVNAGDQPWTYLIDLTLGVGQPEQRKQRAYKKIDYFIPSHQTILKQYLSNDQLYPSFLDRFIWWITQIDSCSQEQEDWTRIWVEKLLRVIETNADSAKAHWGLVYKYIIQYSNQGESALGSSGYEVAWLKKLERDRRSNLKVDQLSQWLKT